MMVIEVLRCECCDEQIATRSTCKLRRAAQACDEQHKQIATSRVRRIIRTDCDDEEECRIDVLEMEGERYSCAGQGVWRVNAHEED